MPRVVEAWSNALKHRNILGQDKPYQNTILFLIVMGILACRFKEEHNKVETDLKLNELRQMEIDGETKNDSPAVFEDKSCTSTKATTVAASTFQKKF